MTNEEIRQKAIECGEDFETMCESNTVIESKFKIKCADSCQYKGLEFCEAVYGYEHGFADGVRDFAEYMRIKCHVDVSEYLRWYEKEQKNG